MPEGGTSESAKTIGELIVENKLATKEQVDECIRLQRERSADGAPPQPLEQIMVEKGHLKENQARLMRTAMGRLQRDHHREETVRIGGYEIISKLGDGGLGTVYKARQISMGRIVALKVLHRKWLRDEEFKKRFLLEARLVGRLSHQNLIQVFDFGKEKGTYYFSMEYVDGPTVESVIDEDGPMAPERALDIAVQILRAITYIWSHKIVHRDIKPGNIMLMQAGGAKLGDFGFVKSGWDSILSTDGEVLGTPDYISPEQALGVEEIDFRSDIYSLGASLYHMLTGEPPFEGSGSQVMRKHVRAEVRPLQEVNPDVPDAVCHIVEKMMAKDPEDRYATCDQLFEDIDLVRMGRSPISERPGAGKSTIIRAIKMEEKRLGRLTVELAQAQQQLARMKKLLLVSTISVAALIFVIVLLVVYAIS